MADDNRIRRALLFMPGDDIKKISKAANLGIDSIIMDIEDGVALANKETARQTIYHALTSTEIDFGGSERLVRLNAASSGLLPSDIAATFGAHPDGYVLPKAETAEEIYTVCRDLDEREHREGLPQRTTKLIPIIETARGVVSLKEIAASDDRIVALAFGAEDLAGSLGAIRTTMGMEVFYGRSAVVMHAAAFGLQALDSPCIHIGDADALSAETRSAMQMGYTGKLAIHPDQIELIISIFTPSGSELDAARRLIDAHRAHQDSGTGVFSYEGRMVDWPMIKAAQRVIARAEGGVRASG
jgi:citrate lyase beta subunit